MKKYALLMTVFLPWFGCSGNETDTGMASTDTDTDADADGDTDSDTDTDELPFLGDLVFDPPSGSYQGSIVVTITPTDEMGGDIRYTTDGSVPDETSELYTAPISVETSTEIQAQLYRDGIPVTTGFAVYISRTENISLNLPIAVLDNFGGGPPDREYERTIFMLFDAPNGIASLSDRPSVAARAGFHLRGQSSANFDKHPYRVELRDRHDNDQDWPVLGMPADSDWVLRGPFADKSLIRDAFHYELGADMGMEAPRFAFLELYTNLDGGPLDAGDYEGVYMLVETIKNTKNRLDLKQLHPEDTLPEELSGGYIFKFDWQAAEEPIIECPGTDNCWSDLEVVDPSDINAPQREWLTNYLYEFSEVLHSPSFSDLTTGYLAWINAASFADQIILNELGRELDAYIRSTYFYKERNELLTAGPLWDYNLSLGAGIGPTSFFNLDNISTSGWTYEQNNTRTNPSNDWFIRLLEDPAFRDLLTTRWKELRSGLLADAELLARIDRLAMPLDAAADRNFERWPNLNQEVIFAFETPATETWEQQVQYVRDWLMERVAWLDDQWL